MRTALLKPILLGAIVAVASPAYAVIDIALVGDSITRGNHDNDVLQGNNYPTHLQTLLDAAYGPAAYNVGDATNHTFFNGFGHGGATLREDGNIPYVDQTAYSEALAFQPDIVFIMLGTNDARPGTAFNIANNRWNWDNPTLDGAQTSTQRFIEDYQTLVNTFDALASAPDLVVMSPIPVSTVVFGGGNSIDGSIIENEIAPAIRDHVANFAQVDGFIDLNLLFPEDDATFYDGDDKIHPGSLGYEFIARQVFSQVVGGDLNGDQMVGTGDLDIILSNWGASVTAGNIAMGDASGDGLVDQTDLDLVIARWGSTPLGYDAPGGGAIPEPTSALLLTAGLGLVSRRRRK